MSEKFTVEIISPDKSIIKSDTTEVTIPSFEGEMGILKDHIPLITFLFDPAKFVFGGSIFIIFEIEAFGKFNFFSTSLKYIGLSNNSINVSASKLDLLKAIFSYWVYWREGWLASDLLEVLPEILSNIGSLVSIEKLPLYTGKNNLSKVVKNKLSMKTNIVVENTNFFLRRIPWNKSLKLNSS